MSAWPTAALPASPRPLQEQRHANGGHLTGLDDQDTTGSVLFWIGGMEMVAHFWQQHERRRRDFKPILLSVVGGYLSKYPDARGFAIGALALSAMMLTVKGSNPGNKL